MNNSGKIKRIKVETPKEKELPSKIYKRAERKIKKDPRVFYSLYKICRDFKPDIIHSWGSMPSIYALPVAKLLHIKFINAMISNAVCKRGSKSWVRARLTFPFSDVVVSNSKAGLIAHNAPLSRSKVIHNGFNFNRISDILPEKEVRKRFNINTPVIVGMVGAFHNRKDYSTFIKASLKIIKNRNNVTFLLVGDGPNLEKCKEMVPTENKNSLKFLGQQNDVESIIHIFNIGVLTTNDLVHKEGVSNSIMEYMAFAKPVIASDGGGTNEIVVDGKTGYIVEPGNADQLAGKIEYLLDNPELSIEMGFLGYQRVLEEFGIQKMVQTTHELYEEVLT
jgi:glycosyltransferase involved in cell wall biosynthesis